MHPWPVYLLLLALTACAKAPPPKPEPLPTTLTWPEGAPRRLALHADEEYPAVEKVLAGYGVPVLKGQALRDADVTLYFGHCDDIRRQGTVARIEQASTGRVLLHRWRPMGECQALMNDVADQVHRAWRAVKR